MFAPYDDDEEDAFNQLGMNPFSSFLRGNPNRGFVETYKCYSVAMMQGNERENVNFGGKIILPQSALAKLASLNIQYPMLFSLHSTVDGNARKTHAGVLEFIAEEGRVYLPHWMMQTLLLEPGDFIVIKNASLLLGNFVKIQPQTVDFLDISDPKAVLENALRNFSTLTQGDIIQINYNHRVYEILVMEVRPSHSTLGISIVETDLEVDFAPPLDYVEHANVSSRTDPTKPTGPSMASRIGIEDGRPHVTSEDSGFVAFGGSGMKLNGKNKGKEPMHKAALTRAPSSSESLPSPLDTDELAPPLNLPFGKLFFGYPIKPIGSKDASTTSEDAMARNGVFQGQGHTLRKQRGGRGSAAGDSRVPTPTSSSPEKKDGFEGKGYSLK